MLVKQNICKFQGFAYVGRNILYPHYISHDVILLFF